MTNYITWAEIEAEIEAEITNYRDIFVAVFRKYDGQPTDEFDGNNRRVVVTARSFARLMRIPKDTFRRWLAERAQSVTPDEREQKDTRRAKTDLRRLPPARKAEIIHEAIKADPTVAAAASRALDERQAEAPKPRVRETGKQERFTQAMAAMRRADTALRDFADAASGGQWTDTEAAAFEGALDQMHGVLDIIRTALRSGSWDEELAKLTDGTR